MFQSLRMKIIAVIVCVVTITTITVIFIVKRSVEEEMMNLGNESAAQLLDTVMLSVENEYDALLADKKKHRSLRQDELRNMMDIAMGLLQGYYDKFKSGAMTEAEAQEHVCNELRTLRYSDEIGYFWITDTRMPMPRMIVNPVRPELEGSVLDEPQFYCAGKEEENVFVVSVNICEQFGDGFVEYLWPKPTADGITEEIPKISYVKIFEPWGWVIGTGLYIDDLEDEARQRADEAVSRLRHTFLNVQVADTGYMYLFDGNLNMLIHPTLEDANFFLIKNPTTGNLILEDLMGTALTPDTPLKYQWEKPPDFIGEYRFWKLSYVRHFPELDWYIASSVYYDELHAPAKMLTQRLMLMMCGFFVISICAAFFLARTITQPLKRLMIAGKAIQNKGIDAATIPVEGATEIRALGEILEGMIQSIRRAMSDEDQLLKALSVRNRELHLINKEAMTAKEVAEDASKVKSQFLSSVSHEIRTPLNCIIGFAETIMGTQELASAHEKAAIILRESDVLLQLINDLLDHAKLEAGKMELEYMPIDLREVLKGIEDSVGGYIKEKGLVFRLIVQHEVRSYVMLDALRLRQVLMNLISNAIKFTEHGSVIVNVETLAHDTNAQTVRFSVIDTGIGIPKDKQRLIFESFQQVDTSTTRKYGGTGLGTSIVRQLVEKMGGELGLESDYGQGSTFWFTVNMRLCTKQEVGLIKREKTAVPNLHIYVGTILVADDYPANQEVIKLHLQSIGLSVDIAENGQAVIDACAKKEYDLILMDVQMPILNGIETTKLLRTQEGWVKDVPILGLTANLDASVKNDCLSSGMNDVLSKPVRKEAFRSSIVRWLYAQHHAEQIRAAEYAVPVHDAQTEDAVLDYDAALEEFDTDADMFHSILHQFLDEGTQQVKQMFDAFKESDVEFVRQEAHKIKGGAANVFALELSECARTIEQTITDGREVEVGSLLIILRDEFDRLRQELAKREKE